MKATMKSPCTKRLKLKCDILLSHYAFKVNLRRYDKERKRITRLLQNRVSAHQARVRKSAYMSTLEDDRRDIKDRLAEMEGKIKTLEKENVMLRHVVKNATHCEPWLRAVIVELCDEVARLERRVQDMI